MIAKLPTNCAPTIGNDKQVGWNMCIKNCSNCKKCVPDPDTNCGQMLIDSGKTDCVPPNCFNQCCKNELIKDDPKPISDSNNYANMYKNIYKKYFNYILLATILLFVFILFYLILFF